MDTEEGQFDVDGAVTLGEGGVGVEIVKRAIDAIDREGSELGPRRI